jgi:TrmH family RNA methyltransferase
MPILEEGLPPDPDFLLICDTIRDPGNIGTIMRTALAARVQAIFLTPGSVDCYSPKVVRSAMGAHFRMPVFEMDWEEIDGFLSQTSAGQDKHIYLADSKGGLSYFQADFRSPLALIVGGEAEGAGKEARQLATERVHIPMPGRVESLNAAVAASILLFEVVRQRMHRTGESPGKRKT